jgi:glycosyltransferase involved in cell wall biosynthesis
MAPRVSIITIFLDEEQFLDEAIASVAAQTFDDWELLLVDDGSTDRSTTIAREAAAAAPSRIRYVQHPGGTNRGMSASRNRGIAEARGELIAFIDGDDVWLPEKLSEQVAVFDAEPEAEMVYGRTLIWHSWDPGAVQPDYFYPLGVEPNRLYRPPQLFPVLVRNRAQTPTTLNAIVRRSLVERVGGFVESFAGMFEDQVFFAKVHLAAATYVDDRTWARYRQHERSCSARSASSAPSNGMTPDLRARKTFLDWLDAYTKSQRRTGAAIRLPLLRARADYYREHVRMRARSWLGSRLGRDSHS